jgi:hypothetical protein
MLVVAGAPFNCWATETIILAPRSQDFEYEKAWLKIHPYFERVGCRFLEYQQEGAALTVLSLVGKLPDDAEILLVNSDQFFTGSVASWLQTLNGSGGPDGSLLTFEDPSLDTRWSYAQTAPHAEHVVTRVAEKIPISTHATAGAYYFRQWRVLRTAICRMVAEGERYNGEFYLAPTYNQLIRNGMTVTRHDISGGIVGVGTPELLQEWEKR